MQRYLIPIIGWLAGSAIWTIATIQLTKIKEDDTMIWTVGLVGLLVLIVLGVIGLWWYFGRDRQPPDTLVKLENMARYVTAMYFAQMHEVTPDLLQDATTPQEMDERARRIVAERELTALRGNENS